MQQLSWLVEKSSGNAPESFLKQLQQKILECDRKGPTNASIPLNETMDVLHTLNLATTPAEVDMTLEQVLAP